MRTFPLLKQVCRINILALCYCSIMGCSSMDDLNVKNDLDFPITIKQCYSVGKKINIKNIGTVPAHTTMLFSGEGSYESMDVDEFRAEDRQGVLIEKISRTGKNVTHKSVGCSGKEVWYITVTPKPTMSGAFAAASQNAK